MTDQNEQFPVFEQLFSKKAQTQNAIGLQTMQKLFFSIRMTAYFAFLKRYDPLAPRICAELMRFSGCAPDSVEIPPETSPDITLFRMLMIARSFLMTENNRIPGYFIVYVLLIRPFAMYAGSTGCFGYPVSDLPEFEPPELDGFELFGDGELPF